MDIDIHAELETKSGIPLDAVVTHADMMRAFEAFKETNDQRIALTEKKSSDVLVDEKLARINNTLDAQARFAAGTRRRPSRGAQPVRHRAQGGVRRLRALR
jgi:predicted phage gp36 major capsid-like protein